MLVLEKSPGFTFGLPIMPSTIALIAHNIHKDDIVSFALAYTPTLARYKLIATAMTGKRIQSATALPVEQKWSSASLKSHDKSASKSGSRWRNNWHNPSRGRVYS